MIPRYIFIYILLVLVVVTCGDCSGLRRELGVFGEFVGLGV
jgi:predicted metal-binding protein